MAPPARADGAVSAAVVTGAILPERSRRRGACTQVALELLDLVVDESGRVRELFLARRRRAEPELPVRLESRRKVVEAHA